MRVLVFLICFLAFGYSFASDAGANKLLVKLLLDQKAYIESLTEPKRVGKLSDLELSAEQESLGEINSTLDEIVAEHSDSHLAVQILTNQEIGSLSVRLVRERSEAISLELNKRACIESVLTDCLIDRLISIVRDDSSSVKHETLFEVLDSLLLYGDGRYEEFVVETFKQNAPYDDRLSRAWGAYFFIPRVLKISEMKDVSKFFHFDDASDLDRFHLKLADKLVFIANHKSESYSLAKHEFNKLREPEKLELYNISSFVVISGVLGVALPSTLEGDV